MHIIHATAHHARQAAQMLLQLWQEHTLEEMLETAGEYIGGEETVALLAMEGEEAVGIALCSLRHDYVEGTEGSPVGYLEGICTREAYRGKGIAKALLVAAQAWAKEKGCREFASDCELDNTESLQFHLACGFEVANRIICFVKELD